MKKEFTVYYSSSVKQQLDGGKKIEDIHVDFRLTVIKPLHTQWLVNISISLPPKMEQMSSSMGWKKALNVGALDGTIVLPSGNPFSEFF